MFVYDRDHPPAVEVALGLRVRLPTGYVVQSVQELPEAGPLHLTPGMVRRSWAWVDADGTRHPGRRGLSRALRACGGRWAALAPVARLPASGPVIRHLLTSASGDPTPQGTAPA